VPELEKPHFPPPLADVLGKLAYRRVASDTVLDPVYRLRYEAYRRENFIPVNIDEICKDDLDDTANGMTIGVYLEKRLIASLRVHHLTEKQRKSPSMKVFPEILEPMLKKGKTFMDPSRFSVDKDASLALPALPFLTLRIGTMAAEYYDVDYTLSLVRPEHGPFYRRVFLSQKLSGIRRYPDIDFDVVLYALDLKAVRGSVGQRFPIFKSTPEEREALFGPHRGGGDFPFVRPTAIEADAEDLDRSR
jgi:hypothetical protein